MVAIGMNTVKEIPHSDGLRMCGTLLNALSCMIVVIWTHNVEIDIDETEKLNLLQLALTIACIGATRHHLKTNDHAISIAAQVTLKCFTPFLSSCQDHYVTPHYLSVRYQKPRSLSRLLKYLNPFLLLSFLIRALVWKVPSSFVVALKFLNTFFLHHVWLDRDSGFKAATIESRHFAPYR